MASWYAAAGMRPGDVVAIVARNQAGWVTTMLGLMRLGAVPAAVNWRLTAPEIAVLLTTMEPAAVVADANCLPVVSAAAGAVPVLALGAPPAGGLVATSRAPAGAGAAGPCLLLHTSGTTGRPKLVPVTGRMLTDAATFMRLVVPDAVPGARHLSALPLFHAAGLANLAYVLVTGGHLHVLGGFEPAGFVDELAARRIQFTQLVPVLIGAVTAEVSGRPSAPDLSCLTEVVYGASPIDPVLLARAVRVLGCRFRQNYASSETGPLPVTSLPPEDHDPARGKLGTAGRPSLGWEVRLGADGEVQVRGAEPLPGYWNDPAATAVAFTSDGFYHTGDVGRFDEDGYLTIVDRLSDMIITGGENVYPAEVEAVLAGYPGVREVAVIGIPDRHWGEAVHAVVAGSPSLDPELLAGWARERLAGFKCPSAVTITTELPRNATGKVLRSVLREPHWAGRERRVS
jgi:acyl-CoA synthetase (AMP-forming)/AMP-acid ligase II